ncbi:MAG: hypothetical protein HY802_06230 [Methanobacterium sp.]|nr:hypothetical protein [Methanobacterium sp.]
MVGIKFNYTGVYSLLLPTKGYLEFILPKGYLKFVTKRYPEIIKRRFIKRIFLK